MQLEVCIGDDLVGHLRYDNESQLFSFEYTDAWVANARSSPLSPHLGFQKEEPSLSHSAAVRSFFQNLLPEGNALVDAAVAGGVSRDNVMGLLAVLGKEAAGALRIGVNVLEQDARAATKRLLPLEELSERVRARPEMPFSVWDQRVRLSIAGVQDKISVMQDDEGQWFLVDGPRLASTHIIKPEPVNPRLAGLTSNEFFCMRMAAAIKLPVAEVELKKVPEPILVIKRFDRQYADGEVFRFPVIDGCQVLGLPSSHKYERPYGDTRDVAGIRDGASLPALFQMLNNSVRPGPEKRNLLRWLIFQMFIGNFDAHAKNLTFHTGRTWLMLAPAYDLVCTALYEGLEDTFAMAIGDAFTMKDLSAHEWAQFCMATGISVPLLKREIKTMSAQVHAAAFEVGHESVVAGADADVVQKIVEIMNGNSQYILGMMEHVDYMFKQLELAN